MERASRGSRQRRVPLDGGTPFWVNSGSSPLPKSGTPQGAQSTEALVPSMSSSEGAETGEREHPAMAICDARSTDATDLHPLIPKQSLEFPSYGLDRFTFVEENSVSAPKRLMELKKWLWLQQDISPQLDMGGCLHVNLFPRALGSFQSFLRKTCMARLFKGSKEKRKENIKLQSAQMQAALSVAGVAAAIAAVAAATAASAADDSESRTGVAIASAAALVAAQCADIAENMGAEHHHVVSAINAATNAKSTKDILNLTAAAATSIQGSSISREYSKKEARVHAAVSPSDRRSDALLQSSIFQNAEVKLSCNEELLAKGCDFFIRSKNGKLRQRSVSLFLDPHKKVILKLRSGHKAGSFLKTERRWVLDILLDIAVWPGRSLLHGGEERRYFGLKTSGGVLEFECKDDLDYHIWTDGISDLLLLAKKHRQN